MKEEPVLAAPRKIVFTTVTLADISTTYLPASDLELIRRLEAPNHLAEIDPLRACDCSPGSIFYVPDKNDGDALWDFIPEALAFGLSRRFVDIMTELSQQEIPFVLVDADGGEVEEMEHAQRSLNQA